MWTAPRILAADMGLFRSQGAESELEQPPDVELVRRMRRGDESALEALYALKGKLVRKT